MVGGSVLRCLDTCSWPSLVWQASLARKDDRLKQRNRRRHRRRDLHVVFGFSRLTQRGSGSEGLCLGLNTPTQ